jgi:hypothetical protein
VLAPFARRDADAKIAFDPLRELHPAVFDNAFGVYIVEFDDASGLSDSTAHKLTALNKLPTEYDLTLVLKTDAITDKSVAILSRLTTTDTIVLDGTGLSNDGMAALDESLPDGTLSRRPGLDPNCRTKDGGEPSDAPESPSRAY